MAIGDLVPLTVIASGSAISLRKLTRADLPLIESWLAEPHVQRWWDPSEIGLSNIAGHLADPVVMPYLIVIEARPVGYFQAYHANRDPFWGGFEVPRETIGIDLFLGPADSLGRGFGGRAIRLFVDELRRRPGIVRAQIDPAPENERAIRTFLSCGFVPAGRHSGPNGVFDYMLVDLGRPRAIVE